MNKYLVILDYDTGVATLHNVGIVLGEDEYDATKEALKLFNVTSDAFYKIKVYSLDEIEHNWSYYL